MLTPTPPSTLTPTPASTITPTPDLTAVHEAVIRDYFHYLDTAQWDKAYDVSGYDFLPDRATYAQEMTVWESVKVLKIRTVPEWMREMDPNADTTNLSGVWVSTPERPIYAVDFDVQWRKDWIPVIPNGVNSQFAILQQVEGQWKVRIVPSP